MPYQTKAVRSHRFILSSTGVAILALVLSLMSPWTQANVSGASNARSVPAKQATLSNTHAMFLTGDVDFDYAANMRIHQKLALDMSLAQLKDGQSEKLRKLTLGLIAAQKKDIRELDRWLAAHTVTKNTLTLRLK